VPLPSLPVIKSGLDILSLEYPQAKQTDANLIIDSSLLRRIEQTGLLTRSTKSSAAADTSDTSTKDFPLAEEPRAYRPSPTTFIPADQRQEACTALRLRRNFTEMLCYLELLVSAAASTTGLA
jgi:hypothetical protein